MSNQRYEASKLREFCEKVLTSLEFSEQDAEIAAKSLIRADMEGAGSHGISRLAIYAKRIKEGRISAKPDIQFGRHGSVLKVDGDNGLGQVVSTRALDEAASWIGESGIAGIFIRNSNHFGTAAYFCQKACERGLALIGFTNSPPGIAPWGGKKAYMGTNPVAFGFPTKEDPPVIIDMSSSVVARGKIILADKQQESIPLGWAIDEDGVETTDPAAALKGAVLPLGGAKGYALAMAVEILAGVLSGSAFGPHVNNLYKENDPPANVGHSFILLDISKWMDMDEYYARMEQFLSEVKNVPLGKDATEIKYPGERRYQTYIEHQKQGIALSKQVVDELNELANNCAIDMKL